MDHVTACTGQAKVCHSWQPAHVTTHHLRHVFSLLPDSCTDTSQHLTMLNGVKYVPCAPIKLMMALYVLVSVGLVLRLYNPQMIGKWLMGCHQGPGHVEDALHVLSFTQAAV